MSECHEEVTRHGHADACGRPAVGERIDPNDPHWYPVCERHFRGTKPQRYPDPAKTAEPEL